MASQDDIDRDEKDGAAGRKRGSGGGSLPISRDDLAALFQHLEDALGAEECDHSLVHARSFLASRSLPEAKIVRWLERSGGYCDCEVLMNVRARWE